MLRPPAHSSRRLSLHFSSLLHLEEHQLCIRQIGIWLTCAVVPREVATLSQEEATIRTPKMTDDLSIFVTRHMSEITLNLVEKLVAEQEPAR